MASLNRVILIGNITKDIELTYTGSGTALVSNSIAINSVRIVNEQKVEEVTFVEITVWGKQAETLSTYQTKGSNILVEGRLKQDNWEDKTTGAKRSKLTVVAERITFLGSPKKDEPVSGVGLPPVTHPITTPVPNTSVVQQSPMFDDNGVEVPF